mgnify:CR=1 FL=1|jgi:hypothetical protein
MSKIEVDQVDPQSGTTLTLGTSGDTVTIPSGVTLANAGTATGFASIAWQSSIVTAATHTASAGQGLWLDTSSNAITLTLPASPSVGDQVIFTDYARNWSTNAVTLNLNSEKFQGNATPVPVYDTAGESVDIVYSGSTKGWIPNSDGAVAFETAQPYNADFLIVAGGGGSGSSRSGGGSGAGGAGGYRTGSSVSLTGGQTYAITVGAGGALGAGTSGANQGGDGGASSIIGTGVSVTSAGGGGGGAGLGGSGAIGRDGGSGGGGGANAGPSGLPFAGGSGNVPSTSPVQGYDGGTTTGGGGYGSGGGGSSGVGADGSGGVAGGAGTANSITGSSVTYAAGGASGNNQPGAAGGANTGDGAAGSGQAYAGNTGGSGIVILSVPDANYSGTTTGSPTVATGVSGKTVMTFTGDGSYTA